MKITDEVLRALQKGIETVGSESRFSRKTNVSVNTLRKALNRKTKSIKDETWDKIYPFIEHYLPRKEVEIMYRTGLLTSDEKILLDAFAELTEEKRQEKLLEIIKLAKEEINKD